MFIGHHGAGLAGKSLAPRVSLGWLVAAPMLVDLIWPFFLLAGIERVRIEPGNMVANPLVFEHYPWTHSLLMTVLWGVLFGTVYWLLKRDMRGALVLLVLVISHWVFDLVTHRPDLPLTPWGETRYGLGLWHSYAGTIVVEGLLFATCVLLYYRKTRAKDSAGRYGFLGWVLFLVVTYVANFLGPPPPDVNLLAYVALLLWIMPFWAAWADRHREVVLSGPGRG